MLEKRAAAGALLWFHLQALVDNVEQGTAEAGWNGGAASHRTDFVNRADFVIEATLGPG